jgi:glycosyltransferase involved in cell wall biosynthesis
MKVIHVTPRYYPHIGGIETHVREICRRLSMKNIDLSVITTDPSGLLANEEYVDGVRVKRFKAFAPHDSFYFCPQIYFFLKKEVCEIVHIHGYHVLSSFFAALAKRNDQILIFTPHYHGVGHTFVRNILLQLYKPIGAKIFEKSDQIICVSEYEKNLIKSNFNIPETKLVVIPNGVDLDEFKDIEPIPGSHKTLLYVGRLEEYKGVDQIIRALPLLNDYHLEIIGKGYYKNELIKIAKNLGVNERISWFEEVSRKELLRHYASADVFLMLSRHEAYGITVAEALAAGTPCIVATGSALEEFVDGKGCLGILPPITAQNLVHTINSLINTSIKKRLKNDALPILDWDEVAERTMDIYSRKMVKNEDTSSKRYI